MNKKTEEIYQYWFNRYKIALEKGRIDKWISDAKENYSFSTQKVILASMQHYLGTSFEIDGSDRLNHNIKTISKKEYQDIYDSIIFVDTNKSIIARLLVRLLWETGVRISEALQLKWDDILFGVIKVRGKGNKNRVIPIKSDLFFGIHKRGDYVFGGKKRMSYSWAYQLISTLGKKCGLTFLTPHTFRHSFASRLIAKNIGIEFLSKILGHKSINTTMIYIHFNERKILEFLTKI